jgi:predicted N-acetyltransferase YhbS
VCSAPEQRGRGLGAAVVRTAFAEVDEGREAVSLFQTNVPGFYATLGARSVGNVFVNPRHRSGEKGSVAQPWWNTHVMIYPAAYRWPDGEVDLGGPGY